MNRMVILGRDPAAPSKEVQCNPLAQKQVSSFPSDGGDMLDGLKGCTFLDVPFNSVRKSICEKLDRRGGREHYSQPSCVKISVTKGAPAKTAASLPFPRRNASL